MHCSTTDAHEQPSPSTASATSRPPWRPLLALTLLGLLVHLLAALPIAQPGTMDSHYYYSGGRSLLTYETFLEPYLWNYLNDPPARLPTASHLYWMPLPSILVAEAQGTLGGTFLVAQLPFILLAAALAPLAFATSWRLKPNLRRAWTAGGLTLFSGFFFPFMTLPETFAPFAAAGGLALFALGQLDPARDDNASPWWALVAGLAAGLGHLCRADGVLLLAAGALFLLSVGRRKPAWLLRSGLLLAAGYLLPMAPWMIHLWRLTGAPLATAGSQTIWLCNYDELFSYGTPLTAARYLDWGWQNILHSKWQALWDNLQTFIAVDNLIFLTPLTLIAGWSLRRRRELWPAFLYGGLLYGVMTLVFTFPGARGGVFHSSAALLPTITALAPAGLERLVHRVARRRRNWQPAVALRVFSVGLILLAIWLSGTLYRRQIIGSGDWSKPAWNSADLALARVGDWLQSQPVDDPIVMVGNPPAFFYHTGYRSIVVPNETPERTLAAARRYNASYLVLDRNRPSPLADLYQDHATHPALLRVWDDANGAPAGIVVFEIRGD